MLFPGLYAHWVGLERAVELLEFSLALFREVNDRRHIGIVLNAPARAVFSRGEIVRAGALLMESLTLPKELGDWQGQAEALGDPRRCRRWKPAITRRS